LLNLLGQLSNRLGAAGIRGDLLLFGGAAMILGWNARLSTRDVDGLFIPAAEIRKFAAAIAAEAGIPATWLNDAVKGFLDRPVTPEECRELAGFSNLRVYIPPVEYLIATKAVAARSDPGHEDAADLKFLLRHQEIRDPEAIMKIVESYFPSRALPAKVRFFIESVLEELQKEADHRDESIV
jgi:hypothetical protein